MTVAKQAQPPLQSATRSTSRTCQRRKSAGQRHHETRDGWKTGMTIQPPQHAELTAQPANSPVTGAAVLGVVRSENELFARVRSGDVSEGIRRRTRPRGRRVRDDLPRIVAPRAAPATAPALPDRPRPGPVTRSMTGPAWGIRPWPSAETVILVLRPLFVMRKAPSAGGGQDPGRTLSSQVKGAFHETEAHGSLRDPRQRGTSWRDIHSFSLPGQPGCH